MNSERRVWTAFFLLSLAWGTSFFFIKIALETLQPLTLVAIRLLIGLFGIVVILRLRGLKYPRDLATWRHLTFMGVVNTAIPFVLITWAESGVNGVDSGVASVLNSTVPIFAILIAGLVLRTERLRIGSVGGVLVGFIGVILLLGQDLAGDFGSLIPSLAVIGASFCYAISGIYGRENLSNVHPIVAAAGQLLVAAILLVITAVLFEDFNSQDLVPSTVGALLWLGLFGSCLAYILYFFILRNWGATRTTLVTYMIPIVGVTAGVIFLDEPVTWQLILGGLLIMSGIGLVNWRPRRRVAMKPDSTGVA
jgi:drug/metabolite transporter (DMT)-like permease